MLKISGVYIKPLFPGGPSPFNLVSSSPGHKTPTSSFLGKILELKYWGMHLTHVCSPFNFERFIHTNTVIQ